MPSEHSGYLAKYLSKERPECLYRWRLWAGFGKGWEWTKVKDLIKESVFSRVYRACKEWKRWSGKDGFFERMTFVRMVVIKTIEGGWEIGRGPNKKPYSMCLEEDLCFAW